MKQTFFILPYLLLIAAAGYSQGVYIKSGSNLFIGAGAVVSLDSLVLKPTANFNITGLNGETRTSTVTHALGKSYIKRVFHFSATTAAFTGNVIFYYRDAELNGIAESALTLNIHNGSTWTAYTTGVTRNSTSNYVSTDGLRSVPLNELTLADNTALLTVSRSTAGPLEEPFVFVYPNPVQDVATVRINTAEGGAARVQLYDAKGLLLQSQRVALSEGANQVRVNMRGYAKGSYTLTADWNENSKIVTLIKQ